MLSSFFPTTVSITDPAIYRSLNLLSQLNAIIAGKAVDKSIIYYMVEPGP